MPVSQMKQLSFQLIQILKPSFNVYKTISFNLAESAKILQTLKNKKIIMESAQKIILIFVELPTSTFVYISSGESWGIII